MPVEVAAMKMKNEINSPELSRGTTHVVVDVDAVELFGRYGRLDGGGVTVGAKTDPSDLPLRPKLFDHLHTAALSKRPVELLQGVDPMKREDVHVLHLQKIIVLVFSTRFADGTLKLRRAL